MLSALIAVLAVQCPDGTPPPCSRPAPVGPNSVAVLLFTNLARDTAYAYLADGLSSEISTSLATVPSLEVRSPGLVRRVQRDADSDPRTIGRRLGVRYVVEGDYQRGGDRIRVSVRLVTVANGTQRWSNAYTRPSSDLLAVQEDVAREVATSIAGQLLPQERTALGQHPTRNPEAWDHFLRGNYYLARRSQDGVDRAVEEYASAVQLDPAFVEPEARIALSYALYLDWAWPHRLPFDSLLARGLIAADRAVALDSSNAEGWMARGYLLGFKFPRDYSHALPALARSVALDPHNAEALHQYASKLMELNDGLAAVELERRALAADPDRAVSQMLIGMAFASLRHEDEAMHAFDSALAINPSFYAAGVFRGQLALARGDVDAACRDAEAARRMAPAGDAWRFGLLVACHAARGDTAQALQTLAEATAPFAGDSTVSVQESVQLAYALARLGRADDAMRWLERARPRGAILWSFLIAPAFDPLRGDARFLQFLDAIRPVGAR